MLHRVCLFGEPGYPLILAPWLKLAWASGVSGETEAVFQHKVLPSNGPHLWPVGIFRTQGECEKRLVIVRYLKSSWPLGSTANPTCGSPEGQPWY